jgi:hypothetical protein
MLITEATGLALDDPALTPNLLAERAAAIVADLLPLRDATKDKRERKRLSSRIKAARFLLNWAKTRAGYVAPTKARPGALGETSRGG